jgi:hypothetical protein
MPEGKREGEKEEKERFYGTNKITTLCRRTKGYTKQKQVFVACCECRGKYGRKSHEALICIARLSIHMNEIVQILCLQQN